MKTLLLAVIVSLGLAWWRRRRRPTDQMSAEWLDARRRRELPPPESPCIQWPINKLVNEQATWNRYRLRRRACSGR